LLRFQIALNSEYGKSGKIVAKLKRRLIQSGDYRCSYNEGKKFWCMSKKML